MIRIFISIIISLPGMARSAECGFDRNLADVSALSQQLPKIISVSANQDIAEFCQVNGFREFDEGREPNVGPGWVNSFYAVKDYRTASFLSYFDESMTTKTVKQIGDAQKDAALKTAFEKIKKNSATIDQPTRDLFNAEEEAMESTDADQGKGLGYVSTVLAPIMCSELTLLHLKNCSSSMKKLVQQAHPVDGVALLPIWRDVVNDPVYMKVYKSVSIKILENIKSKKTPTSRFFDDLKDAFLKETHDPGKAEKYAWKTQGILASGGANAYRRTQMIGRPIPELDDLLFVLSNGSLVLDRYAAEKGFLYTSPKEVNNVCDNGKNYHFWMTAYLARSACQDHNDSLGAAAAAYSVEKAYQFGSQTSGRDPRRPFVEDTFSNTNNNIRLDLSLASAGAWYGAQCSNSASLKSLSKEDIATGIQKTFGGTKMLPRREMDEDSFSLSNAARLPGLYLDWKKIINPNESFYHYQQKMSR
jgi:hypothetical protein